ncbi:MAG: hypothetical protein H6873_09145 [Hyphomicrobiaceae bacterium]|nr:hypothetical protein [Hyphomicrobiaceae bacterium]
MSTARKVFFWVFGIGLAFGLLLGLGNLVAPDAVSVTMNGENVEGVNGIGVGLFAGGLPGFIIGLIAAGITALFTRKKKA